MGKFQCLPRGWCDETHFVKNCFMYLLYVSEAGYVNMRAIPVEVRDIRPPLCEVTGSC